MTERHSHLAARLLAMRQRMRQPFYVTAALLVACALFAAGTHQIRRQAEGVRANLEARLGEIARQQHETAERDADVRRALPEYAELANLRSTNLSKRLEMMEAIDTALLQHRQAGLRYTLFPPEARAEQPPLATTTLHLSGHLRHDAAFFTLVEHLQALRAGVFIPTHCTLQLAADDSSQQLSFDCQLTWTHLDK